MFKKPLTAEQIAELTENKDGSANIRAINKYYRDQDESRLYPINNRFNATERAIRRVRAYSKQTGAIYGLEYCYMIESELSNIVNNEV